MIAVPQLDFDGPHRDERGHGNHLGVWPSRWVNSEIPNHCSRVHETIFLKNSNISKFTEIFASKANKVFKKV